MTGDWNDDDIERTFAELRAADRRDAPLFDATYAAALAAARKRAATSPWRRAAAAAAILVVAGGGWLMLHSHVPPSPSRLAHQRAPTPLLSEWRSPTAFLLQGPDDMLVKTLPIISASSADLTALGVRARHRRHS